MSFDLVVDGEYYTVPNIKVGTVAQLDMASARFALNNPYTYLAADTDMGALSSDWTKD